MREVYIEFTRPKKTFKPLSWAIRAIEGTEYSHVRLRFTKKSGINMVYEASGVDVNFRGPLALEEKPTEVVHSYKLDITPEQFSKMVDLCVYHAAVNYGYIQLVGILLVRVLGLVKNPLSQGRKSQVCSEVVGRFLQEILNIGHDLNLDTAGPREIQRVIEDHLQSN